jgi:hypothetical protein
MHEEHIQATFGVWVEGDWLGIAMRPFQEHDFLFRWLPSLGESDHHFDRRKKSTAFFHVCLGQASWQELEVFTPPVLFPEMVKRLGCLLGKIFNFQFGHQARVIRTPRIISGDEHGRDEHGDELRIGWPSE